MDDNMADDLDDEMAQNITSDDPSEYQSDSGWSNNDDTSDDTTDSPKKNRTKRDKQNKKQKQKKQKPFEQRTYYATDAPRAPMDFEFECPRPLWQCKKEEQCILPTLVCNGEKNCRDGTDELDCEGKSPTDFLGMFIYSTAFVFVLINFPSCAVLLKVTDGFLELLIPSMAFPIGWLTDELVTTLITAATPECPLQSHFITLD